MAATIGLAYYNLSMMLAAGVPLVRSLRTVGEGLERTLRDAFLNLADAVTQGDSLAETMSQSPHIFNPLDVMIVQAAERSGSLPEMLGLLSKWYEFSHGIRKRLLSGLALPGLVFHIAAFVGPLPGFFLGGRQVGPYLHSVIGILLLLYIPATIIFVVLRLTPKTGLARATLDHLAVRIPVLGRAVYRLGISRYCWAFHMLSKAGIPVTETAEKAAAIAGNAVVAAQVKGGTDAAKAGGAVSEGFSRKLPADFLSIWLVAEESGRLDEVTLRLAENYGQSAEFWFAEFASWLPR
ncbi:MAG: type II secretion system F family protein, partial [Planctomycetota bacterium]